jgi:hypothetical protein
MVNSKVLGIKMTVLTLKYQRVFTWNTRGKPPKPGRIFGASYELRTAYFMKTSREFYCYRNLLDEVI